MLGDLLSAIFLFMINGNKINLLVAPIYKCREETVDDKGGNEPVSALIIKQQGKNKGNQGHNDKRRLPPLGFDVDSESAATIRTNAVAPEHPLMLQKANHNLDLAMRALRHSESTPKEV